MLWWKIPSLASYGRLRLLVDQSDGGFSGCQLQITLERVAHVPDLGRYNLISKRPLADAFSAPVNMYPVVTQEEVKVRWVEDI